MADPLGLVFGGEYGQPGLEGTGAAQIFDSSKPAQQAVDFFGELGKERRAAAEADAKQKAAARKELDKIAPEYGIIEKDVPYFEGGYQEVMAELQQAAASGSTSIPYSTQRKINSLKAEVAMQKDQAKQIEDYRDRLEELKGKVPESEWQLGKDALDVYVNAGSPRERLNLTLPIINIPEKEEAYTFEDFWTDAKEPELTQQFETVKEGTKYTSKKPSTKDVEGYWEVIKSKPGFTEFVNQNFASEKDAKAWYMRNTNAFSSSEPTSEGGGLDFYFSGNGGGVKNLYAWDVVEEQVKLPIGQLGAKKIQPPQKSIILNPEQGKKVPFADLTLKDESSVIFAPSKIIDLGNGNFKMIGTSTIKGQKEGEAKQIGIEDQVIITPDDKALKKQVENTWFGGQKLEDIVGTSQQTDWDLLNAE